MRTGRVTQLKSSDHKMGEARNDETLQVKEDKVVKIQRKDKKRVKKLLKHKNSEVVRTGRDRLTPEGITRDSSKFPETLLPKD